MRATLLLLTLGSAAIAAEPTPIEPDSDPCRFFETETKFVNFNLQMQLKGITVPMAVPKIYMEDRWKRKDGVTSTAFLFRVGIADFEPVTRAETSRRRKAGRPTDWMSVLLGDAVPMEDLFLMNVGHVNYTKRPARDQVEAVPAEHGLYRILPLKPDSQVSEEVLVDRIDEVPEFVLRCNLPSPRYHSYTCLMDFEHARISVSASFLRSELPNWREIHARSTQFVQCAIERGQN